MSGIKPTLDCPCAGAFLREAFVYTEPPVGETRFDLKGQPYRRAYDRCELCGHFFSRHDLDLSGLYSADYVDATYGGIDGMRKQLERIRALPPEHSDNFARVQRIMQFFEDNPVQGRRLLDVGAGIGVFPSAMKNLGWEIVAIEPDPRTVEHLRSNVCIEAFCEDFRTLSPADLGYFDLVTFNKVLEHVNDPVTLLKKGASFLGDGGCVYIELPDADATIEGFTREEFFIDHHHVFSKTSTALLIRNANLLAIRIEALKEASGKYSIAGFSCKQTQYIKLQQEKQND